MNKGREIENIRNFYQSSVGYLNKRCSDDQNHYQPYLNATSRYVSSSGRVLDIGCGTGYTSYLMGQTGKDVVGLDLSHLFLSVGRYKYQINLCAGDATKIPFKNDSFEFVAAHAVVEHILEIDAALTEMIRVLKPGGTIVIVSPNLLSPFLPIRALFRLLAGKAGIPVFGETFSQAIKTLIFNIFMTLRKTSQKNVDFTFRSPDLNSLEKPDADAVYLANQIEIKRFFKYKGLTCLKRPIQGRTKLGKVLGKLFPNLSGLFVIVAKKDESGRST